MTTINPMAFDISHYQAIDDKAGGFKAAKTAGFVAMIHKSDQGTQMRDRLYHARVDAARQADLLTGAYHFNTGDNVAAQIDLFFASVVPDAQTMMALDFEDNSASNMSLAQAIEFLKRGDDKLGRPLWIYSGNRMKELVVKASAADRDFLAQHPLWLCEYGAVMRMVDSNGHALPWSRASLWQFTGDGVGPAPHRVPGIMGSGLDINSYDGTADALKAEWIR